MTTACGSTTSSQDTPLTLNEAPFWKYLEILRAEGYEKDADASELFYKETLTAFGYSEKQVMDTSFGNIVKAVELIVSQAQEEIKTGLQLPSFSGKVMTGKGADELSEEQLQYLMRRQQQLHEEEKTRLGV